jgi:branched-chain amino acid transport system substrate-binding protein
MDRAQSGLVVVVVLSMAGCAPDPAVGVLTPQSGPASAYGHAVSNGLELAVAEAQSAGVLPPAFRLVTADTGSDPATAASELRQWADDKEVELVVGGVTTDEALALVPVVEDEKIVCLSPSASASSLTGSSPYFFRLFATDEVEGSTAARFLATTLGLSRVLVVTDDSTFSRGLEAEFRQHFELRLGGTIVATIHDDLDWWQRKTTDMIHAHQPEAVYVVGHADHIRTTFELLARIGYRGVRCTTSAIYLADHLASGDPALEGVVFPLAAMHVCDHATDGPGCPFAEHFVTRYGCEPDLYAAHGYDAMRVAIKALLEARSVNVRELRRYMRVGLTEFDGVTGTIAFDERGDARRYPTMHTIWHGQVVSCEWLRQQKRRVVDEVLRGITPSLAPARLRVRGLEA